MASKYTLEWLDNLVNDSLNPANTKLDGNAITPASIQEILIRIEKEQIRHQQFLNDEVFHLLERDKIEVLINQYYSTLTYLLNQNWQHKTALAAINPLLLQVQEALNQNLQELIEFIEVRFSAFVHSDQKVSISQILVLKDELLLFLNTNWQRIKINVNNKLLTDVISNKLQAFISDIEKDIPLTVGQVRYIIILIKSLKELSNQEVTTCITNTLNELLIYLNFNSSAYLKYLRDYLSNKIASCPDTASKVDALLLLRKEFDQKHCKSGITLNPDEDDLLSQLRKWINLEIQYLENKYRLTQISSPSWAESFPKIPGDSGKILCELSVDQLSLLLRAASDLNIIKARSLNAVFKQIVPHLSTPTKADISWDSMRSKSYAAEKKDIDVAIQTLEKIIRKVKEY